MINHSLDKVFILYLGFFIINSAPAIYSGESGILFPEIAGMHRAGPSEIYDPENLYEYINGAAESYLIYEFRELAVQIYENEQKQSVIVEIYRHENPVQSFGIYSQERPQVSNFLQIGAQAYYEKGLLNFLKGDYYIKIRSYDFMNDDRAVLTRFAEETDKLLPGDDKLPRSLSWFPEEGKIENSERFISQSFLGYIFFTNVFTADYRASSNDFKLFLLEAQNEEACKGMLQLYLQSKGISYEELGEDLYSVNDPYQGTIGILRKNKYLLGSLNLEAVELRSNYLRSFWEKIQN